MRAFQAGGQECAEEVLGSNRESFEELIAESRVDIFSLAVDLTGDCVTAREVVEEVFLRIHKELNHIPRVELERLLHRYTYDAALSRLVERIGICVDRIADVTGEIAGAQFPVSKILT